MDKVRVPVVEDGLGYEERLVFAYLFWKSVRERVVLEGGMLSLAKEMRMSVKSLNKNLKSLEEKKLIKLTKTRIGTKQVLREIKLKSRGYDRVKVARDFLYIASPKARGLLLTLAYYSRPRLLSNGLTVRDTFFYLKDMKAPDARDFKTLKKLLRELKSYALILILRTRPYHVVRIIG